MALKKLIYTAFVWRGLNYISVFLLNIITARILGASASGEVYYIITFFSLIILFASLNLESALTYFSLTKEIKINYLISAAFAWIFLFSIIFISLYDFFSGQISYPFYGEIKVHSLFFIAGMLLTAYYTALFYGQKSFGFPNFISFLANASVLFLVINFSINYGNISTTEYLRLYFSASLLQGVAIAITFHFLYTPKFAFHLPSKSQLRKIFSFSAFTFATSAFLFLLYRVDYWLIARLNSSPNSSLELGNYIQVSKLIFSFQVFSSMVGAGIFSGTVSNEFIKDDKLPGQIIRSFFYLGIVAFLILLFFGRILFAKIYGEGFELMNDCFLLILPGAVMLMTVSVTANYLSGLRKLNYNLFGVAISLALMITMNMIFIPRYGIYAAATISGISYFFYGVFMLFQFSKYYGGGWSSILSFRNDLAFVRTTIFKRNRL